MMSIIGRKVNRSIRQMMRGYFAAKADGADHIRALNIIVQTWYQGSPTRAYNFWNRYWRIQAEVIGCHYAFPRRLSGGVALKEINAEAQLKGLVFCLVQDRRNPFLDDEALWLIVNLEEIHAEVKAEFKTPIR